jgi:hypothetical protein
MAAGVAGIAPSASGEIGGTNEATAPTEPTPVSKNARSPDLRTRRLIIMSRVVPKRLVLTSHKGYRNSSAKWLRGRPMFSNGENVWTLLLILVGGPILGYGIALGALWLRAVLS